MQHLRLMGYNKKNSLFKLLQRNVRKNDLTVTGPTVLSSQGPKGCKFIKGISIQSSLNSTYYTMYPSNDDWRQVALKRGVSSGAVFGCVTRKNTVTENTFTYRDRGKENTTWCNKHSLYDHLCGLLYTSF